MTFQIGISFRTFLIHNVRTSPKISCEWTNHRAGCQKVTVFYNNNLQVMTVFYYKNMQLATVIFYTIVVTHTVP